MSLNNKEKELILLARSLAKAKKIPGGELKGVGCALITKKGKTFTGVSIDLPCGIGFCAEHSAISNMISHSDETEIALIVATGSKNVMYPCGRCRELIELINKKNRNETWVITPEKRKVKLKELLPGNWMK